MKGLAARATASIVLGLVTFAGPPTSCAVPPGCPETVAAAREAEVDDRTFLGGGYVIRFIPSPDPRYRGYDVNVTTPVSPSGFVDTAFLRVPTEISGIAAGDPVLLVGDRERGVAVMPGRCPPLTLIDEDELDW